MSVLKVLAYTFTFLSFSCLILLNDSYFSFLEQDYVKAITLYSSAIEHNPTSAVLFANRSLAYLRTECFGYALDDASKAITLDKSYVKGYYRRGIPHIRAHVFSLKSYFFVLHSSCIIHGIGKNKIGSERL